MKRLARPLAGSMAGVIVTFGIVTGPNVSSDHGRLSATFATPALAQASPCAFPTAPAATPEQTAWQLFVAANCPTGNNNKVVWEEWVEQSALYPGCTTCAEITDVRQIPRRLHGSHVTDWKPFRWR